MSVFSSLQENNLIFQSGVQPSLNNTPITSLLSNAGSYAQLHSCSHTHSLSQSHANITSPTAQGPSHTPTPTTSRTRTMFPTPMITPKLQQSQTARSHMATLRCVYLCAKVSLILNYIIYYNLQFSFHLLEEYVIFIHLVMNEHIIW